MFVQEQSEDYHYGASLKEQWKPKAKFLVFFLMITYHEPCLSLF